MNTTYLHWARHFSGPKDEQECLSLPTTVDHYIALAIGLAPFERPNLHDVQAGMTPEDEAILQARIDRMEGVRCPVKYLETLNR